MGRASLKHEEFKAQLEEARAAAPEDAAVCRELASSETPQPINGNVEALVDRMDLRALGWVAYHAGISAQDTADITK